MDKDIESDRTRITRAVLNTHHDIIVQDILGDVIVNLLGKQILTATEYTTIKNEGNSVEAASLLLDLLKLKSTYAFNQFLNYMSANYSWLAESLECSMTDAYNNACLPQLRHVLTSGEVPQLTSRHVSRTEHAKELKTLLKRLEAGSFIVLMGMTGCGKSSLIIDVLNDPLITMQFMEGMVQWINVGRENLDVGCVQTEILNRINRTLISIPIDTNYESKRKILKTLWNQKYSTHGLLILDDVCNKEIVNYLDIGCKILITTHDRSIMDDIVDSRISYMKVNEGFEENETLDLLSKSLNIDCTSLPSYASKLHNICKGFPLTISLIGAQLEMHKEDTIVNMDRWKFYLEELSDKTNDPFKYTQHSHNQFKSLEKAIEICINSLPNDLRKKYQDFSLFVHDINIKPEVLCVLWNLKKIPVEDIMLELINKSLVVRVWIQPLNSYVYSVHDLLLSYLKKTKSQQESKELHRQFIEKYRTYCNGNFANLPKKDNYIFLYFGYHLKNANMLEEFPLWFLNLKFLESKICTTGPADLLADLVKYRKYINIKNDCEEYIKEIEEFVKSIGPDLYKTKCDIVQLGLLEPETSFVHSEADKIAKLSGKPYFYYNIRASHNCVPKPNISIVRDNIETVIFGKRYDEVLVATESGSIKLWNIMLNKCLYTYFGHTQRVTHMMKNKSKDHFLSTSDDTTIRIWKIKSFPDFIEDPSERSPSPETRQDHWQNAFQNKHYQKPNDSTDCVFTLDSHTGPVIFAQFSSDGKLVVSSSTDKKLKIWKLDDFVERKNFKCPKTINHTSVITKCYFMENKPNDNLLYLTHSQSGSVIHGGKYPFEHFAVLLILNETILSFFPLPSTNEKDEKLLVMTPTKVKCYKFQWATLDNVVEYSQPISKLYYILFSISEGMQLNSFRYLAYSLSNSTIQICNFLTGYNYLDLNDPVHDILNLDWFFSKDDQCNWLLCAAKDKSIRVWGLKDMSQYTCTYKTVTTGHQSNSESEMMCKNEIGPLRNHILFSEKQNSHCFKLKQNFDALWLENSSLLVAAIAQCGSLKILFDGLDQWTLVDEKVTALSIVHSDKKLDKTMIIVACKDFNIYSLKSQTSQLLFKTIKKGAVEQLYTYYDGDVLNVVALLKCYLPKYIDGKVKTFQIYVSKTNVACAINIKHFIDCFVFRDKVIFLHTVDNIQIVNIDSDLINLQRFDYCSEVSLTNSSIMLDCSTLALTNLGSSLKLYNVTTESGLEKIDEYDLPFETNELIHISVSNNKQFIVVGGQQMVIVFVDIISKTVRYFTTAQSLNIIHSIAWSSDDTRFLIKEPNQIMLFDVKLNSKIASMKLTGDKVIADFALKEYIAINITGNLVMLSLKEQ